MADIFISYSRQDSEQTLSLAEHLRAAGMNVWIDQYGIEAAASWSKEIVTAIKGCKAFCLLLSEASLASNNVIKETLWCINLTGTPEYDYIIEQIEKSK